MLKFFVLSVLLTSSFYSFAAQSIVLKTNVKVCKSFSPRVCFVLMLSEAQGDNISDSVHKLTEKRKKFFAFAKQQIPGIQMQKITLHTGTAKVDWPYINNRYTPEAAEILLFTLPVNEKKALQLIDAAKKNGMIHVEGRGKENYAAGAVFYGVYEDDPALDEIYALTRKRFETRCAASAAVLGGRVGKMGKLQLTHSDPESNVIYFREIKITLPAKFISADPQTVDIPVELSAEVSIIKEKGVQK